MRLNYNGTEQCIAVHINNSIEAELRVTTLLTTLNNVGITSLFSPVLNNIAKSNKTFC